MDRENVKLVVRTTLMVMARIAKRTRTQADDLLAAILQSSEDRIVDVVLSLMNDSGQPPTEEQIVEALASAGIRV